MYMYELSHMYMLKLFYIWAKGKIHLLYMGKNIDICILNSIEKKNEWK